MSEDKHFKNIIEALLFATDKPLSVDEIKQAFDDATSGQIEAAIQALGEEYAAQDRGFRLAELAGGYQLVTDTRYAEYLKKFFQAREKKKLSQASLESLSVIAYKQPVTRADIEFIRGVNVDGALKTLLEKNLVKIVGRKDVPGRPMLYGTTKEFLDHFGLKSLKELPALNEYTLKDIDSHLLPPELKAGAGSAEETPVEAEAAADAAEEKEEA